jgi:hypothetical protein
VTSNGQRDATAATTPAPGRDDTGVLNQKQQREENERPHEGNGHQSQYEEHRAFLQSGASISRGSRKTRTKKAFRVTRKA